MDDDFVHETKVPSGMKVRPDCQVSDCKNPKESALCLMAGKWVCGDCAMKKQEEINARFWG